MVRILSRCGCFKYQTAFGYLIRREQKGQATATDCCRPNVTRSREICRRVRPCACCAISSEKQGGYYKRGFGRDRNLLSTLIVHENVEAARTRLVLLSHEAGKR